MSGIWYVEEEKEFNLLSSTIFLKNKVWLLYNLDNLNINNVNNKSAVHTRSKYIFPVKLTPINNVQKCIFPKKSL